MQLCLASRPIYSDCSQRICRNTYFIYEERPIIAANLRRSQLSTWAPVSLGHKLINILSSTFIYLASLFYYVLSHILVSPSKKTAEIALVKNQSNLTNLFHADVSNWMRFMNVECSSCASLRSQNANSCATNQLRQQESHKFLVKLFFLRTNCAQPEPVHVIFKFDSPK